MKLVKLMQGGKIFNNGGISMKLENRVALITGASRGIGRAIALRFALEGADVVVNYVRDCDAAQAVAKEVSDHGRRVLLVKADVSNAIARLHLIDETLKEFGRIDVLVNNAGILLRTSFAEATEEAWDTTLNINMKSVYFLSRLVAESMIMHRDGKIINIASQSGTAAVRASIEYGLSKCGVMYLTRSLARVLAPHNINVNCISPGRVFTDMTDYAQNPEKRTKREREIPLGRINQPSDIACAAVFLASEESQNMTGQILSIDGGGTL